MANVDLVAGEMGPMGKPIKDIIIQNDDVLVYMDADDTIQWTTENYKGEYHDGFGEIQNKISDWENKANRLFNKGDAYSIKCILAEAYARILDDKNIDLARDIIDRAINTIEKQGREILKQYYIISSFISTLVIAILILLIKFYKPAIQANYGRDEYCIILTMLFGGIGAFIFTTIRLKNYKPDIVISKQVHAIDGSLRIFYGLIFGLMIGICIKANILLGFLNDQNKNIYLSVFMGMCAGASELIIPNLIKQIETKTSNEKS